MFTSAMKRIPKGYMECPKCMGTGKIVNPESFGAEMRAMREAEGYTLRDMAKRMKISAMFLSDMERGRRNWSGDRIALFRTILSRKKC